jgi:uncharacterized SAM-binding protein YcdF (DUF218 family)
MDDGKVRKGTVMDTLFIAKKCITPFLIPPGIFVFLLLVNGLRQMGKGNGKNGFFQCVLGLLLWLFSLAPFSNLLLKNLENGFTVPKNVQGDVIVVLGGGMRDEAEDLSGKGVPKGDSLERLVTAARLEKRLKIPVIVSGGAVFKDSRPEAPVMKRILVELGVPANRIMVEEKSRDTIENAKYSKEICGRQGYKKIILLTSSYHLKRSEKAFRNNGLPVTPYPANIKAHGPVRYGFIGYLPAASSLMDTSVYLKEYLGMLFYAVTPKGEKGRTPAP